MEKIAEIKQPQDYPRRIFVAVTGLAPQVVTETLYALSVRSHPRFIPTEVRLITTFEGKRRAILSLLHPDSGWFHRLCVDYQLPEITFGAESIHVLEDANGRPLCDIRNLEDNTSAANTITEIVRDITRDPNCAIHVSIAGGRKTMGFYLGYALSLYGREQDRLSHVLVSAPYESNQEFYYPSPKSRVIHTQTLDRQPLDAYDATVTLADIPFVRMRGGLNTHLMEGKVSFSSAVEEAQGILPPVVLVLEPSTRKVRAGGECFAMSPAQFAFYWMLADRARLSRPGVHWTDDRMKQEFLGYRARIVHHKSGTYERAEQAYTYGLTAENFNPLKAHIKKHLERHLGRRRASPYLIQPMEKIDGTKYTRFGLCLPPEAICIMEPNMRVPERV